jgi:cation transport ATPase
MTTRSTESPQARGARPVGSPPSPWRTPFARRTYLAGLFWAGGVLVNQWSDAPDQTGRLAIRLDPGGLLCTAAAACGGANFLGAGIRALRSLRLDMNFLMSAAMIAALLVGEASEAATLALRGNRSPDQKGWETQSTAGR